jgi:glutamate/tyrosine decarboxylase-like PLP-dependent enzyme
MSEISKKFGLWFHVDAAYGGYFMLCDGMREKFKGIEASDSVVVDPHKGLFLPYGLGVCLIREGYKMKEAFTESANYMQDAFESEEEVSPADVSPELTKHFRGLRLWLPLKLHGVAPFRASLEEKLLLTQYFYQEIQKIPGFEVGPEPELSVVTYWYVPSSGDINAFNQALIKEIHKDGRVFISSTMIDGRFTLRLAVLVFRSHLEEVDLLIEILKEKTAELDH